MQCYAVRDGMDPGNSSFRAGVATAPVAATNCQSGQLVHRHACCPQAIHKTRALLVQDKDDAAQLRFARRWVNCHVDAAAAIGKPCVLAEFGKKGGGPAREEFYRKVRLCCQGVPKTLGGNLAEGCPMGLRACSPAATALTRSAQLSSPVFWCAAGRLLFIQAARCHVQ